MDAIAVALSGLSLLVAVILGVRQQRLQTRVTEMEESRRAEEVASRLQADVTVSLQRESRSSTTQSMNTFLVLENRGPALAEDVDMNFEADGWDRLGGGAELPVTLDAYQRYPVQVVLTHGGTSTVAVLLRWRDGTGLRTKSVTIAR